MKLNNKQYDIAKWVLMTLTPALILLISALGEIYHFEDIANTINLTIGAFAIFLRTILGISSANYNKDRNSIIEEDDTKEIISIVEDGE